VAKRQRRRRRERRLKHARLSAANRAWLLAGAGVIVGAGTSVGPTIAHADQYTVTSASDSSDLVPFPGTLRRAVYDANQHPGSDSIVFDSSLSGQLASVRFGAIEITDGLTVSGPGARNFGAFAEGSRIFTVDPNTAGDQVTISGLELINGYSSSAGGGILNQDAKLTISGCWFLGNRSADGVLGGGAIADVGPFSTQTKIEDSKFIQNSALNGSGGAIASGSQLGTVVNSTFLRNDSHNDGGAVFAGDDGGTFQNVTIADNETEGYGGGIAVATGGPNISLQNSIVADNTSSGPGVDVSDADPIDAEFSLIGHTSGLTIDSTVTGSNLLDVDPKFRAASYFDHGLPILKPAPTSPVIDQGRTAGGVTSDERGAPRPLDLPDVANSAATGADGADMGAVEETLIEATPEDLALSITDTPDPATVGDPLSYQFRVDNNGANLATHVVMFGQLPPEVSASTLSGSCDTGPRDPYYGTRVYCDFGDVPSGASHTGSVTVTPQPEAISFLYISAYGEVFGAQTDPDTYDNVAYADTTVRPRPPAPPPAATTHARPGITSAIRRCKKKFHGRKRRNCIKRAKRDVAKRLTSRLNDA
jgi:predicted outer membrane repeat protein